VGKLLAGALVILAIAAIALLAYRPARIIGANEKSMAYSLRQEAGSPEATCREKPDDTFDCVVKASGSSATSAYLVDVDDWGCWDARSRGGGEAAGAGFKPKLSGCITIADLIRSGD
jgi:hypothetical protein